MGSDARLAAEQRQRVRPANVFQPRSFERYRILNEHGSGGLGRVSRARDQDLGRDVAIKEPISRNPRSEARFHREALITARLEHPGIVPVHEAGRWPDGTPFYAMKLVSGRPLRDLIAERTTVEERVGLLHHVIAVADAIAYAHGRNIIHRDLKPANVIVGEFGETFVIDWGLAKDISVDADGPSNDAGDAGDSQHIQHDRNLTATGSVLGTPAYMAPEQERGEHVDQRADVFALGAMLWELCALQKVPPADKRKRDRVLRRDGIDGDLAVIIDKALDPDPARRYPDAGALAADLKAFKSGTRVAARNYSLLEMLAHWTRRHRALAASAIAFVVLLISSAVVLAILYRRVLETRMAQHAAELGVIQGELEGGRQALLHNDVAEALPHLTYAYAHGDHSPGTSFMLARALQPGLAQRTRFDSISGQMWSAAFSPDGQRIVTADDGGARVWDAHTNQLMFTLVRGTEVYQAVYSIDGQRLLTTTADAIQIWDASTGTIVRELGRARDGGDYFLAAMSPNGKLVAAIDSTGALTRVLNADTGAVVKELSSDDRSGWPSISFSADGRWLASCGGNEAQLFDTRTWKHTASFAGRIRRLSFDPTGPRLAAGGPGGDVAIWGIPSGVQLRRLRETGEPIDSIAFSPDGNLVATASSDGVEQVWQAGSGRLQSQGNYLHSHIRSVEFDRTSKLVLAAGSSGTVVVADVEVGRPVAILEGPISAVRSAHFDPSGRRVIGASLDGTARVWDTAPPYRRWSTPPVADECLRLVSLEPDRRFVAIPCKDHDTRVWDTARNELLAEVASGTEVAGFDLASPAVSAAGDRVAIARNDTIAIYELPGGRLLRTLRHPAGVTAVAYAPTGHDLVSGTAGGSVRVTHDDGTLLELPELSGGVDAVASLLDGRVLAVDTHGQLRVYAPGCNTILADIQTPSRVGLLRRSQDGRSLVTIPSELGQAAPPGLWDLEHYRLIAQLEGHVGWVFSARFVRDGRDILTAGSDGTARLWDGATGHLLQTYRGSTRFLADATLHPDGSMIVAGGGDGLLRFWDASTARQLWTMPAHRSDVAGIHFEGEDIVTWGWSGDVARWRLPKPENVIATCEACNAAAVHEASAAAQ